MSNKQIEKPLELPHQETIVGTNTIQTKPFDNQKTENMSNNKQSSVELLFHKLWDTPKDKFTWYAILEEHKAKHKEEIDDALLFGDVLSPMTAENYYKVKFGDTKAIGVKVMTMNNNNIPGTITTSTTNNDNTTGLDLNKLRDRLDNVLNNETADGLNEWMNNKRNM